MAIKDFEMLTVSSLEKVLPDRAPQLKETYNTCFKNQTFNFQAAYYSDNLLMLKACKWFIGGDLAPFITVRPVRLVPCTTPVFEGADEYYITKVPTLIPDLLSEEDEFHPGCGIWQSLFVTVKGDLPVGKHEIEITAKDEDGLILGACSYTLEVLDEKLPDLDLKYTRWLHYDSIAAYYRVKPFSDKFVKIMSKFVKNAVAHGVNMLYVPLFTTPTNTKVGGERLTTQLVDAYFEDGYYRFDFSRLKAFFDLAEGLGIKYFEFSHLYTQWGALYAPKIIVNENGKKVKKFGWHTPALGDEYKRFISSFLPALIAFLKENGYDESKCFFHISDEPNEKSLEHYLEIKRFLKPMLGEYKTMDALSDFGFYKTGAVDMPVVATECIKPFTDAGVDPMMVYYCCSEWKDGFSNSFTSMPLYRTRVIGIQLYAVNAKGLLHWGYNYYNTALSEEYIDPYAVTDAGGHFPSGDSFIVYPGKRGTPLDSLRHEVLFEAFEDYKALKLLEKKIGRDGVLEFIYGFGVRANFYEYPKNAEWIIEFRKELDRKITEKQNFFFDR